MCDAEGSGMEIQPSEGAYRLEVGSILGELGGGWPANEDNDSFVRVSGATVNARNRSLHLEGMPIECW